MSCMTTEQIQVSIPEIGLPQRCYLARDKSGMTQAQLAEAMGVTRKTVTNTEGGAKSPRRPTLAAWALATGVPMGWLETGKAPNGNDPDEGDECPQPGSNRRPADYKSQDCTVFSLPIPPRSAA